MMLDTEAEQDNIDEYGIQNDEQGGGFPEAPQD